VEYYVQLPYSRMKGGCGDPWQRRLNESRSEQHQTTKPYQRGAKLRNQTVSAFVVEAATTEAGRVIARSAHTVMPAEQFDLLIASLDEPDDAEVLAKAARRPRRFTRE